MLRVYLLYMVGELTGCQRCKEVKWINYCYEPEPTPNHIILFVYANYVLNFALL